MSVNYLNKNSMNEKNSYYPDMDFDSFRKRVNSVENGIIDEETIFHNDLYSNDHSDNLGEFFCKLYQLSVKDGKLYKCPLISLFNKDIMYNGANIVLEENITSEIKHLMNIDEFRFSNVDVDVIERKIIINLDTRPIEYISFGGGGLLRTLPDNSLECWEDEQWFPFDTKEGKAIKPDTESSTNTQMS